jgi:hypothetical protein
VVSLIIQSILFALEENAIHQRSKTEVPGTVSNPYRFAPPTDNPRQHYQQEEETPYLYTGDNKSKAWVTTLSKTCPQWSNDHHYTCNGFKQG